MIDYHTAATSNAVAATASATYARRFQFHTRRPLKEANKGKGSSTSNSASETPAEWAVRYHGEISGGGVPSRGSAHAKAKTADTPAKAVGQSFGTRSW